MHALLDSFRLALGTFRGHPLRSVLTLLGIVIGAATVVTMMSLIEGLRLQVNERMSLLGADSFQVTKRPQGPNQMDEEKIAKRPNFTLEDREAILQRCPSVRAAAGEDFEGGQVVQTAERETRPNVLLWAVTADYLETNGVAVGLGRSFSEGEERAGARVVVLGADVAETLFPDQSPLEQVVRLRSRPFRVIGVLERRGGLIGGGSQDNDVVVPLPAFRQLFGNARGIEISMAALTPELLSKARDEVTQLLRERRRLAPHEENNFEFFSNDSMLKMFNELSAVIAAATFAVCLLSLVVGGIGILNIMLVSVTERTREIGVRKALGARRRIILAQFTVEAVLLSLLGGAAGVALGAATAAMVRWTIGFPTAVPGWAVAAALALSSGVGLAFGIYPAARAARLDPVEAMRAE